MSRKDNVSYAVYCDYPDCDAKLMLDADDTPFWTETALLRTMCELGWGIQDDNDDVEYYCPQHAPVEVKCRACGNVDVDNRMNLEKAGWLLDVDDKEITNYCPECVNKNGDDDYRKNLTEEYEQLLERIRRLGEYLENHEDTLPRYSYALLYAQRTAMRTYLRILTERMQYEGVFEDDCDW